MVNILMLGVINGNLKIYDMKYVFKLYIILISIILSSCSPCKFVAKHPDCFMPDSVIINKETVRYEKEYITNDSIIFDTIPCNPVENFVYKTKTVYKTNYKTIIDTIYQSKEVSKINPVNELLESENMVLNNKLKNRTKALSIISPLLFIFVILFVKRIVS